MNLQFVTFLPNIYLKAFKKGILLESKALRKQMWTLFELSILLNRVIMHQNIAIFKFGVIGTSFDWHAQTFANTFNWLSRMVSAIWRLQLALKLGVLG